MITLTVETIGNYNNPSQFINFRVEEDKVTLEVDGNPNLVFRKEDIIKLVKILEL